VKRLREILAILALIALHPATASACAACYGQSDSAMAKGLNWGIFSLLVIVVSVLAGIAGFFVHVARRSETLSVTPPQK
jgi:heme/copper-type cytochrome/quinol oxidase subunit 2